jgi:hypothetical protein
MGFNYRLKDTAATPSTQDSRTHAREFLDTDARGVDYDGGVFDGGRRRVCRRHTVPSLRGQNLGTKQGPLGMR